MILIESHMTFKLWVLITYILKKNQKHNKIKYNSVFFSLIISVIS